MLPKRYDKRLLSFVWIVLKLKRSSSNTVPASESIADTDYRRLLARMDEGFCVIEKVETPPGTPTDFRYVEVNAAFELQSGVSGVLGKTVRETFPGEHEEWFTTFDEILHTGQSQRFEHGLVMQGRLLEVYAYCLDETPRPQLAVLFADITRHKEIERDLRESETRLRELNADLEHQVEARAQERALTWNVSPDLLGALNSQGYFVTSNPAWKTLLGWNEAEVASMSIFEMLHPDDLERTRAGFELTQVGQPAIRFPNRYRCKDGSYKWISWVGIPVDGLVYCTGRDITEEKVNEEALAAAQAALRQSQKMEAIGQLTGGLAHDFNNLLAGISGNVELAVMRVEQGQSSDAVRNLLVAQEAVKRAAALTHRLLAFSRRQALDPQPVNANRLVASMEELIRRTMGPSIEVEVIGAGRLWTTLVDPNQLESALLNLAINARDAMPDGGRLTIEKANKWLDEIGARDYDLPAGQYVSICVTDTGIGMSPHVIAQAFDPFFTTKPLGKGTGLGLSMVHGFARQSGGEVRIYSEEGKGTTMCLYFPRLIETENVAAQITITAPSDLPRAHGETILVVEDESTIRSVMVQILTEAGYRVIEASEGPAALELLRQSTHVDLLLTDVGLPGGVNGRQIADAARVSRPNLQVLFVTGYAENAVIHAGHLEPGMRVMTKPFSVEALLRKVREMIAG